MRVKRKYAMQIAFGKIVRRAREGRMYTCGRGGFAN